MKYCLVGVFLWMNYLSIAQVSTLDSLKSLYGSSGTIEERTKALIKICDLYNGSELNDDSLRHYSRLGFQVLKNDEKHPDLTAFYTFYAASHFYKDTSVYFNYLRKAEKLATKSEDELTALNASLYQIIRHQNFAQPDKVKIVTERCFPLIEKVKKRGSSNKEDIVVSRIYAKAAANALSIGDIEEALRLTYLLKYYAYEKDNLTGKIETYDSFIHIYKRVLKNVSFGSQSSDKRKIDSLLRQSLDSMYMISSRSRQRFVLSRHGVSQINKADYYSSHGILDSAKMYYERADTFASKYHHNLIGLKAQQGLFDICNQETEPSNCYIYIPKMDSILAVTNTDSWSASVLERKIKYFSNQKQYKKANAAYEQLKIIVNKYPENQDYLDAYQSLVNHAENRNFSKDALKYFKKKTAIEDSISAEVLAYDVENLRIKYNVAQVQADNARLKGEKAVERLNRLRLIYGFIIVLSLIGMAFIISHYRNRNRILDSQHKGEQFKQKLLRSQISPHFTFNVLGTIQGYIYQGKLDEAESVIGTFAKLIRKNLEYTNLENITVQEEINFIDSYLRLEKGRKNGLFDYEIVVDDFDLYTKIQPLFIQPLVENSIKHGFRNKESGGFINVKFTKIKEGILTITVSDNGDGYGYKKDELNNHKSLGLELIRERMDILNKSTSGYDMKVTTSSKGTITTLTLPYV